MSKLALPKGVKDRTVVTYQGLTAIEYRGKNGKGYHVWLCTCNKCGNETVVNSGNLQKMKSCGCVGSPNLTGQRFGKLVVIKKTARRVATRIVWQCLCDCGTVSFATTGNLVSGHKKSCNCLNRHPDRESAIYSKLYKSIKRLHKKRGGEVATLVTLREFTQLSKQACAYCAAPPYRYVEDSLTDLVIQVSGIDRIDSSLGYVQENTVSCCTMCNGAKTDHSLVDFKEWAIRLSNSEFVKG